MAVMNEIQNRLENARLPAEERLWQTIRQEPFVLKTLQNAGPITLFGTDPEATMENLILADLANSGACLTVIEKNPKVIREARARIPEEKEEKVRFLCGSCFEVVPLEKPKLVIAKHLIHWYRAPQVVQAAMEILGEEGLFFASTPPVADWKTKFQLWPAGITYETKSLGKGLDGGTLFLFRKPREAHVFPGLLCTPF